MTKRSEKRRVITSKQPCPVCGSTKWHPLKVMDKAVDNEVTDYPMIDVLNGSDTDQDECAKCHTVVC